MARDAVDTRRSDAMVEELLGIAREALRDPNLRDARDAIRGAMDLAGEDDPRVEAVAERFRAVRLREGRRRRRASVIAGWVAALATLAIGATLFVALGDEIRDLGAKVLGPASVGIGGVIYAVLLKAIPVLRRPKPSRYRLTRKQKKTRKRLRFPKLRGRLRHHRPD